MRLPWSLTGIPPQGFTPLWMAPCLPSGEEEMLFLLGFAEINNVRQRSCQRSGVCLQVSGEPFDLSGPIRPCLLRLPLETTSVH